MHPSIVHARTLRGAVLGYLKEMISIPTVNPPGLNYEAFCEYAAARLRELNCDVELVHVPDDSRPPGQDGYPRVSVVGRYRGSREESPGLHLSGHYDVVPPGSTWKRNPFEPAEEDGRLYGLGASDMKGGLASIMGVLRALSETDTELRAGLTFSFTPDEETGGFAGMGYLARQGLIKADFAIFAEPSQPHFLRVGHKGALWLEVITKGRTAHSGVPHLGVNAFKKMVKIATALEDLEAELGTRSTGATVMTDIEKHPTMCVGSVVRAGVKANVVPDECSMMIDRRLIPEESLASATAEIRSVIERLQAEDPELDVELVEHLGIEGAAIPTASPLARTVAGLHRERRGQEPSVGIVSGFNDTRFLIRDLGIPAITYGPGTTATAHTPDEYIVIDDLEVTTEVLLEATLALVA